MNLKNKVVVITGGSEGLGEAMAKGLILEECKIIISSNDQVKLQTTAQNLNIDHYPANVKSITDLHKLSEYVVNKYGHYDIWINNAGIQIAPNNTENIDIMKLHELFNINFFGYFYGCQIAIRQMKKQGAGAIININSTAGLGGKPQLSAYSSSKFAIRGLTESIRQELINTNIRIYGIFPGGINTNIYKEKVPEDIGKYMNVKNVAEKIIANLKLDVPEEDLVIKRPSP